MKPILVNFYRYVIDDALCLKEEEIVFSIIEELNTNKEINAAWNKLNENTSERIMKKLIKIVKDKIKNL